MVRLQGGPTPFGVKRTHEPTEVKFIKCIPLPSYLIHFSEALSGLLCLALVGMPEPQRRLASGPQYSFWDAPPQKEEEERSQQKWTNRSKSCRGVGEIQSTQELVSCGSARVPSDADSSACSSHVMFFAGMLRACTKPQRRRKKEGRPSQLRPHWSSQMNGQNGLCAS